MHDKIWRVRRSQGPVIAVANHNGHELRPELAALSALESLCREKQQQHGAFVVLDLHSYNHRRDGPSGPEADPAGNPEVNIGTGTMDRQRWGGLVDRLIHDLRSFDFLGHHLDVRENVKFVGRQFPRWAHTR